MLILKIPENFCGIISRAVIYTNNFYIFKCLVDYTVQTFVDIFFNIINRYNNGDFCHNKPILLL